MPTISSNIDYAYKRSSEIPFPALAAGAENPTPVAEASATKAAPSAPREQAYGLCASLLTGDWLAACAAIYAGLSVRDWQRMGWTGWPGWPGNHFDLESSPMLWSLAGGTL